MPKSLSGERECLVLRVHSTFEYIEGSLSKPDSHPLPAWAITVDTKHRLSDEIALRVLDALTTITNSVNYLLKTLTKPILWYIKWHPSAVCHFPRKTLSAKYKFTRITGRIPRNHSQVCLWFSKLSQLHQKLNWYGMVRKQSVFSGFHSKQFPANNRTRFSTIKYNMQSNIYFFPPESLFIPNAVLAIKFVSFVQWRR